MIGVDYHQMIVYHDVSSERAVKRKVELTSYTPPERVWQEDSTIVVGILVPDKGLVISV